MTAQMSKITHARETLALGLPLAGAQLAQMALHVTDVVNGGTLDEGAARFLAALQAVSG